MTEEQKREQLYKLAKDNGLDPHSRHGVPKLEEMLVAANVTLPSFEPNEPVLTAPDEPEKLPPEEVLHNKLVAYGVERDQHKETLPDLEAQLKRVLAARARAAEKRKIKDQGDYYGKTATIRITKQGDDRVGTGEYIAGIGNICYAAGEVVPDIPLITAEALEERGFAEIQS